MTIILPLSNVSPYVAELVANVRASLEIKPDEVEVEIVLVDDGSIDDGARRLEAELADVPHLQAIHHASRRGAAAARNTGLAMTTGDWVWFCDADDAWAPSLPWELLREAANSQVDLVVAPAVAVDGNNTYKLESPTTDIRGVDKVVEDLLGGSMRGFIWNKLFRRLHIPIEGFPDLARQEDFHFLVSYLHNTRKIKGIRSAYYEHRVNPGSLSRSRAESIGPLWASVRHIEDNCPSHSATIGHRRAHDHFRLWFYEVDGFNFLLRHRASTSTLKGTLRDFRGRVGWPMIRTVFTVSPKVAITAGAIRAIPVPYSLFYVAARSLRALIRASLK